MKNRIIACAILVGCLLMVALGVNQTPASAQSGGAYDLTWNTFDGGGATFSTGGAYSLGGTIGQADAGMLSGGSYSLSGGFWVSGGGGNLYLPFVAK